MTVPHSKVMNYVGICIFKALYGKYRNNPDILLKIVKIDRSCSKTNKMGFDIFEYGNMINNDEGFVNQFSQSEIEKQLEECLA